MMGNFCNIFRTIFVCQMNSLIDSIKNLKYIYLVTILYLTSHTDDILSLFQVAVLGSVAQAQLITTNTCE